ncbi:MAG: hypothetical protein Q4A30_00815 [Candidatus Saccharibacteria bacterium]|nr:hypothetical protein [Candidatus Saccharibacteria bacterium]
MKYLILNQVAIWQPKLLDKFTLRPSPAGRTYFENGVAKISQDKLYRYAKNYKVKDNNIEMRFCLFVVSPTYDLEKFEKFLDEVSKNISVDIVKKVSILSNVDFEYINYYFNEEKNNG